MKLILFLLKCKVRKNICSSWKWDKFFIKLLQNCDINTKKVMVLTSKGIYSHFYLFLNGN